MNTSLKRVCLEGNETSKMSDNNYIQCSWVCIESFGIIPYSIFHTPNTSRNSASFAGLITLMDMKDSCYSALPTMAGASLTS